MRGGRSTNESKTTHRRHGLAGAKRVWEGCYPNGRERGWPTRLHAHNSGSSAHYSCRQSDTRSKGWCAVGLVRQVSRHRCDGPRGARATLVELHPSAAETVPASVPRTYSARLRPGFAPVSKSRLRVCGTTTP